MELSLEDITIHYEVFGAGRPIIVLPGWSVNTRLTSHRIEPDFEGVEGWQRIYIDPPGHGKTPGKDWIRNQDDILDVVIAAIDKLTEGERFCLLGISQGAYLARGVLRERAGSIDGIAMLVPLIVSEDERRTVPPYEVLIEEDISGLEVTEDEAFMVDFSVIHTEKWVETFRDFPVVPEGENGDAPFLERIRMDPAKYGCSFDVDDLERPFPGPALMVMGRQDAVVGYQDAWDILDNFPRATFAVLDRVGHLREDCLKVEKALVNEWLERVEEYAGS